MKPRQCASRILVLYCFAVLPSSEMGITTLSLSGVERVKIANITGK